MQVVNVPEGMIELRALAIGGSVGTPAEGITAEVVIVNSLDEVDALGRDKIEGKIVFYNRAFDQTVVSTGAGYGGAVDQRGGGPSKAAEYGAAAVVIRSVSSAFDDEPHTGGLRYRDGIERIPAAALGFHSADRLTEILKESPDAKLYIRMTSQWHPDARSYNVVGEIRGSEKPDEIILVGGHLDSWDVAEGAHDDPSVTLIMNSETLQGIVSGETDGMQAFMAGQLRAEGDMMLATKLGELFNMG